MFAPYQPQVGAKMPRADISIRPATAGDLDSIAVMSQQREGGTLAAARERARRWLASPPDQHLTFVAEAAGDVVGHAHVALVQPSTETRDDRVGGWYLSGVTIASTHRRRGIGLALTRHRLGWIAQRATEAFYFANSVNRASIDLHERLGFTEIRRNIIVPGASFSAGGIGILFRVDLPIAAPADGS